MSNQPGPPSQPPSVEWFASGTMDPRKFDDYLLSPTHPDGKHKLLLWRSVFGIGEGDRKMLERLIREQLYQAEPVERPAKAAKEDPDLLFREWTLVIPSFRGPNSDEGPVITAWALAPGRSRPHFTNAYPDVD